MLLRNSLLLLVKASSLISMLATTTLLGACGQTQLSARVSQIYLRPGLETCTRLEDVRDEDRPAIAANPALTAALDAAGVTDHTARLAIQAAAGDYARTVQATERVAGVNRDLDQMQHNRVLCEQHGELVAAVRHNNAGPTAPE